jgi:hypothetical protein
MSYLFVLAGAGGAFVPVVVVVVLGLSPQPVNTAPAKRLTKTNRIYFLFISS